MKLDFRGSCALGGLLLLLCSVPAAGAITMYTCREIGGKLTIQDAPCPPGTSSRAISTPSPRSAKPKTGVAPKGTSRSASAKPTRRSSARTQIAVCDQLWQEQSLLDARRRSDAENKQVADDLKRIEKELCRQDCLSC